MQVLIGNDVDVISPFPVQGLRQAAQWMHCYKTLTFRDDGPQTIEDIERFLGENLPRATRSWGIIDKNNLTGTKQEAPLVGLIYFDKPLPENGYFHIATNRRAWGERIAQPGLAEQAGRLILNDLWSEFPELQRVSAFTYARNKAAVHFLRKLGCRQDGYFQAMGVSKGVPQDVVHFGVLRPKEESGQPTQPDE